MHRVPVALARVRTIISAYPLGRSQHRCRVDGLVGRDHHEGLAIGLTGRGQYVLGSEDVRLDSLGGEGLHQRNVLVRRRVIRHVRRGLVKDALHPCRVANVGDYNLHLAIAEHAGQLALQVEQARLIEVERDQLRCAEAKALAAELRSDRPRRPGDQHRVSFEVSFDQRRVDADRVATQ